MDMALHEKTGLACFCEAVKTTYYSSTCCVGCFPSIVLTQATCYELSVNNNVTYRSGTFKKLAFPQWQHRTKLTGRTYRPNNPDFENSVG